MTTEPEFIEAHALLLKLQANAQEVGLDPFPDGLIALSSGRGRDDLNVRWDDFTKVFIQTLEPMPRPRFLAMAVRLERLQRQRYDKEGNPHD